MIYDASQDANGKYALCAFYAGYPTQITSEYIQQTLLPSLEMVFGHLCNTERLLLNISFHNWIDDPWTCDDPKSLLLKKHNSCMADMHSFGNSKLREPLYHSIYFASTKTENEYGHIQGALKSGQRVVTHILSDSFYLISE